MENELRTERTFGVTAQLKPTQRRNLWNLQRSEIYPDLLDVLEMVRIEQETALINTDPADEKAVLANHKMAKASRQIFTHMQEKIDAEAKTFQASIAPEPPVPELTAREMEIEEILNPLSAFPSESDDYMGM